MNKFFSDLWIKVKADATNAFALGSTAVGNLMAHIDDLASGLNDPALNDKLHSTIFTDAKLFGKWMAIVGTLLLVARFKKLVQSPPKV